MANHPACKVIFIFLLGSMCTSGPEAQFLVPDWGNEVHKSIELSYRPARLAAHSRLYPPVRVYEFDYWISGFWALDLPLAVKYLSPW